MVNFDYFDKFVSLSTEFKNAIAQLKEKTNLRIANLEERIDFLDIFMLVLSV